MDLCKGIEVSGELTILNGQDRRAGAGPGRMERPRPYRSLVAPVQVLLLRWQDKPSQWKAAG